jgi:hypothetical protein
VGVRMRELGFELYTRFGFHRRFAASTGGENQPGFHHRLKARTVNGNHFHHGSISNLL